ncbi:MAG: ribosome small subunit-dependent GTPase A [Bacteroidetes bacterium]|nr:ribosome small subunit-dependent GTPase A [Bacteroidota bacterium]MDA0984191.1 ribosome small subunit-dependent GTPase A [Bacteroidota bacterium]
MKKGLVYRSTGSWYSVESDGCFYACRIKGKLRLKGIKSTNPIAVGDRVWFEVDENAVEPEGTIVGIEERQNYIVRKSVNLSKQTHIIASNIDQVFLLITLHNPPTFTAFIDRFLVTAEAYHIPAVLVFNKMDTCSPEQENEIDALATIYQTIGYKTLKISATEGQNIDEIKSMMQGKVSMFSGHSGVGKSTLINAIAPDLNLKTAALSDQHQQGIHTTTFAEMFALPNGMKLIDTPGIKGFGVVDMQPDEIGNYFPEFTPLRSACKFHNCMHQNEPQCAVIEAFENGIVAESRYQNYLQMLETDSTYR